MYNDRMNSTDKINELLTNINGAKIEIDSKGIVEARNFALLWPMFENSVCYRSCDYSKIR